MIVSLMIYMTVFSLLVGLAALAIERAVALGSWPRRWLWAAAMVISLAGATTLTLGGHSQLAAATEAATLAKAKPTSPGIAFPPFLIAAQPQRVRTPAGEPVRAHLKAYAKWLWTGTSMRFLGLYCVGALRLLSARSNWSRRSIGKYQVFVTHDVGPAVFGLIRPAIVLPRWLLNEPVATLEAALAHENEHLAARDPALLLAALLLLAASAWNLPLWWQLRRLKLAIEVDCDTRVLRTRVERRLYALCPSRRTVPTNRAPVRDS
jgi:bla regulator protein BlaR1